MGAQLAALSLTFPKPYDYYVSSYIAHFDTLETLLDTRSIAYPFFGSAWSLIVIFLQIASPYTCQEIREALRIAREIFMNLLEIWQEHYNFQIQQPQMFLLLTSQVCFTLLVACGLARKMLNCLVKAMSQPLCFPDTLLSVLLVTSVGSSRSWLYRPMLHKLSYDSNQVRLSLIRRLLWAAQA
jgi:hypothetical protein